MKRLKIGKPVSDIQAPTLNYIKSKTDFNLLTDKGVYPYDYMNSWDKFDETNYQRKKIFTVNYTKKTSLTKTMPEQLLYGNMLT